ncbi:hydrolase, NUDIX family [Actinomyces sp. oral taxon 848 str. F0332]|nr:hydrolase, NUDIX family [Actinomyces sp. oral taxon 848 str. F0332]
MTGAKRAGVERGRVGAGRRRTDAEHVGVKRGSAGVRQAGEERAGSWTGAVRVRVERDEATRRDPKALAAASENPRARFLFVSGARVAVKPGAERVLAVSAGCVDLEARSRAVYLGLVDGAPYFACDVGDADDSARDPQVVSRAIPAVSRLAAVAEEDGWARYEAAGSERPGSEDASSESAGSEGSEGSGSKRASSEHAGWQRADSESAGCQSAWPVSADFASVPLTSHLWPSVEAELAVEAVAISNWIGGTRFCHRCGEPLSLRSGGWEMLCGRGHTVFPRVDPAVIMAVRDVEDRLLLARNGRWAPGRLSVLAGFVEAGEPLESAVAREVLEETGVVVDDVAYVTSQPWPFPRSLMLAFEGRTRARQEDVKVDGEELVFARFFSREEFSGALASGEIGLPTPTSVSARLIERWLGRPLADAG